jgi:hypothetical protein
MEPSFPFLFPSRFNVNSLAVLPFGISHVWRISLVPTKEKAQATNLQLIRGPIAIETSVEFEGEDFILLTRSHHPASRNETIENFADNNVPLCRASCSISILVALPSSLYFIQNVGSRPLALEAPGCKLDRADLLRFASSHVRFNPSQL